MQIDACCVSRSVAVIVLALVGTSTDASAQSQTRSASPANRTPQYAPATQGSSTRAGQRPAVELRGFCPVCLVEMAEWIRGNPQFQATYDGKVYYFPQRKQLEMFQANPVKYVPALGGDCVVHFASTGKRVPGKLDFGVRHRGRVYFFDDAQHKSEFLARPDQFADVDLALGGECTVCRVEMQRRMPGRPNVAAVHEGMRYLFAGAEQRNMFLSSPEKYAPATLAPASGAGSSSRAGSDNKGGSGTQPATGSGNK